MEAVFENPIYQPDVDNVIPEDPMCWNRVDRKYRHVLMIRAVLFTIIFTSLFYFTTQVVFEEVGVGRLWTVYVFAAGFFVFSIVKAVIEYSRRMYVIRQHDLMSRRGFLSIKVAVMPFVRVQQVKIEEGVLSRIWNLASIHVSSASSGAGDVVIIAGIPKAQAEEMRKHIVQKINKEHAGVL
ncbi:MAG TPA: PH domain-containing protein [Chitinophagaceae bacterium]|nr:PH domain-containing protein [Chitinophagaceae bacterium]